MKKQYDTTRVAGSKESKTKNERNSVDIPIETRNKARQTTTTACMDASMQYEEQKRCVDRHKRNLLFMVVTDRE
jgi:hypothetical protein